MPEPLPRILEETAGGPDERLLRLRIDADMPLFPGHFPGYPILPGVLQVHWAARLGQARFAIAGDFSRLVNLKFQKLIRPDSEVELALRWDAGRRQLAFAYTSTVGAHASGKLEFHTTDTPA